MKIYKKTKMYRKTRKQIIEETFTDDIFKKVYYNRKIKNKELLKMYFAEDVEDYDYYFNKIYKHIYYNNKRKIEEEYQKKLLENEEDLKKFVKELTWIEN